MLFSRSNRPLTTISLVFVGALMLQLDPIQAQQARNLVNAQSSSDPLPVTNFNFRPKELHSVESMKRRQLQSETFTEPPTTAPTFEPTVSPTLDLDATLSPTTDGSGCPESICPLELRDNGSCEARCNLAQCQFDSGDCRTDGNSGDQFTEIVFYGILAIMGGLIVYSCIKGACNSYSEKLGMTYWERIQIMVGYTTRAEITGENGNNDGTEDDREDTDSVREASPVNLATEADRQGEERDVEGGAILPVASRASIASSALPTAAEFNLSRDLADFDEEEEEQEHRVEEDDNEEDHVDNLESAVEGINATSSNNESRNLDRTV